MAEEEYGNKQQNIFGGRSAPAWALRMQLDLLNHIDNENHQKANFVIAADGVLLAVSLSQLNFDKAPEALFNVANVGWLVIAAAALISIIAIMVAVQPLTMKRGGRINLYWPGSYVDRLSKDEYVEQVKEMLSTDEDIVEEASREMYEYSEDEIIPKLRKVKVSTYVLVTGLMIGTLLIGYGLLAT